MNLLKITFLLTCLTLLLVAMGSAIGGQSGMLIAFSLACGMNLFSYWYSDKIILKMYKAREVSETENPSLRDGPTPRPAGEYADAQGLHHPLGRSKRIRHGTQSTERGRSRH
nr:hypothetical protein [Desulfuromonas sp. TF]